MSSKYLLPCRCGQQIAIEPRQAGETVVCRCGASLHAPRMLEIMALEPAPAESGPPPSGVGWGWRQRTKLLGVILLSATIIAGVILLLSRPVSRFEVLSPEEVQRNAHKLTPSETWDHWQWAKRGLDRRTDQQHAAAVVRFRIWLAATVVLALAGVGLIAVGMTPMRGGGGHRVKDGGQDVG
ncbi:MAG: hypothetical protein KKE86_09145 [Planctomycetes bacterium]|nr:hypothetical protein [Planctomycetota bacterium]MBU4399485.1 hypothetical protein [Planctomycetota bacterium]MCG2682816.1 hypothetical protein [Planctomycetales bacterium]